MLTFTLPLVQILVLVSGAILPLIVGLITTRVTAPGVKAVLLLVLAIIANVLGQIITALQTGESLDVGLALLLALGTFLIGGTAYTNLWKPTGLAAATADVLVTPKSSPSHAAD